jgi:hypothetical protein
VWAAVVPLPAPVVPVTGAPPPLVASTVAPPARPDGVVAALPEGAVAMGAAVR